MKSAVLLVFLSLVSACSGPEVPVYPATSPASPNAAAAVRQPVAKVLGPSEPPSAPQSGHEHMHHPGPKPASEHQGHEHHHHHKETSP